MTSAEELARVDDAITQRTEIESQVKSSFKKACLVVNRQGLCHIDNCSSSLESVAQQLSGVTATVCGCVSALGPDTVATITKRIDSLVIQCQKISSTLQDVRCEIENEVTLAEALIGAHQSTEEALQKKASLLEGACSKAVQDADNAEHTLSWLGSYIKNLMVERLAWQEQHGLNPAELSTVATVVAKCRHALTFVSDSGDCLARPGASASVAQRFLFRTEISSAGGHYVTPREELALLRELTNAETDVGLAGQVEQMRRQMSTERLEWRENVRRISEEQRKTLDCARQQLADMRTLVNEELTASKRFCSSIADDVSRLVGSFCSRHVPRGSTKGDARPSPILDSPSTTVVTTQDGLDALAEQPSPHAVQQSPQSTSVRGQEKILSASLRTMSESLRSQNAALTSNQQHQPLPLSAHSSSHSLLFVPSLPLEPPSEVCAQRRAQTADRQKRYQDRICGKVARAMALVEKIEQTTPVVETSRGFEGLRVVPASLPATPCPPPAPKLHRAASSKKVRGYDQFFKWVQGQCRK